MWILWINFAANKCIVFYYTGSKVVTRWRWYVPRGMTTVWILSTWSQFSTQSWWRKGREKCCTSTLKHYSPSQYCKTSQKTFNLMLKLLIYTTFIWKKKLNNKLDELSAQNIIKQKYLGWNESMQKYCWIRNTCLYSSFISPFICCFKKYLHKITCRAIFCNLVSFYCKTINLYMYCHAGNFPSRLMKRER